MADEEHKKQLDAIEDRNITKACEYLRGYEQEIGNHLAQFVASLCNIDVDEMFSNMKNNYYIKENIYVNILDNKYIFKHKTQ